MALLEIVGLIVIVYYLVYAILPWFLDCNLQLAFYEKFGKPINSLKGQVVWLVGASSGIGEHTAYVLAKAGCKIILSARRESDLNRVKANCLSINAQLQSDDIEVLVLDICDLDLHEKAFQHVINKFGKLDILLNNAGYSQRAQWENITVAVDKEMFEINVFSQLSLSRLVAKYFLEVGSGHFVVNSSLAGLFPVPYSATYCGTKHALQGYYRAFKLEKATSPIAVTLVCPGPIQTDFLAKCYTERIGQKYGENTATSMSKVSAERCAELMGVAIANQLSEVWISKPSVLIIVYLTKYFPNVGEWIITQLGVRFLQRLRDDKDIKIKN